MTLPAAKQQLLIEAVNENKHTISTAFGNKQYLGHLSLDELFNTHRPSVFFLRQKNEAASNLGILANDLLVIDRKLMPKNQQLVVMVVAGELRLGIYKQLPSGEQQFFYGNQQQSCLPLDENMAEALWGVVIGTVRSY